MEAMFAQHHNKKTKFICNRFANVANSNGSVIPFWLAEAEKGNKLKLTDPNMNRLMFSKKAAAELIWMAMTSAVGIESSFILCKVMKTVNMLNLANVIGDGVEIVGKRPGEKLNETLISEKELPYTAKFDDGYVYISTNKQDKNLTKEHSSANAEVMSEQEMKELIWN